VASHQLAYPPATAPPLFPVGPGGLPGQWGGCDCGPRPDLRCLVVDHQPAALEQLARMLRTHPYVRRVSTAVDPLSALRMLRNDDVDVVFLEVRMPGMDGMDLACVLKRLRTAPAIVFVSACQRRAADAFDVGAVDYLTKPPAPARLAESVRRVAAIRRPASVPPARPGAGIEDGTGMADSASAGDGCAPHTGYSDDELIPVELGGTTRLVRRSTVRWAQARRDYVRLYTSDGSHLIRARLSTLADCWRAAGMIRTHRSYLVNSRFVTELRSDDSGRLTVVVDGHHLPVSRRTASSLRRHLRGRSAGGEGGPIEQASAAGRESGHER
jgi:DNA-binding LytR/AlgR family response regulator